MTALKAIVALQRPGNTNTRRWTVILATLGTWMNSIDRATRVAHRLVGQGFDLNQAQLCVIPVSSNTTSHARRRRTS